MDGSNARSAVAPTTSASPSRPVSSLCPREQGREGADDWQSAVGGAGLSVAMAAAAPLAQRGCSVLEEEP
jgi:hypothetical protein